MCHWPYELWSPSMPRMPDRNHQDHQDHLEDSLLELMTIVSDRGAGFGVNFDTYVIN